MGGESIVEEGFTGMGTQCVIDVHRGGTSALVAPPIRGAAQSVPAPREAETSERHASRIQILGQLLLNLPRPVWIILDAIIIWAAMVQGFRWFEVAEHYHHAQPWLAFGVFALCLVVCSLIFGLNDRATLLSSGRILTRMVLTVVLSCALAYTILYVMMYLRLSRRVAAVTVVSYLVFGTGIRLFATCAIRTISRRLLVVGHPKACRAFAQRLEESGVHGSEIVGFVHGDGDSGITLDEGTKSLGTTREIVTLCRSHRVRDIVVCNGIARDPDAMNWMLACLRMGCRVTNEATFYESSVGRILVDEITPEWFLFSDLKAHCEQYAMLKRAFDVVVSVIGLCISLPFYPLVALAIKLEDGGPVFYSQDRVGRNGTVFKLYKFRTMRPDAENGESRWASRNDPRITRVGRLLRLSRLDEFPQFYNILIGDMSVVGPRPERPDIDAALHLQVPYWSERHLATPGLTGWAQISFHYSNTVEDAKRKLQYDFYYLKHMSLELDVIILFRTLGTFLRGAC
ncbi:MAG: sugar transferase [Phycisphaerales bacterium]|nr:sugar transferase [Phycisphaerales bacterium]